jgi:NAD(P) transhydrogenase subunit beta
MLIIEADHCKAVIIMKHSMAAGFAGIENLFFYKDKTRMLFGDAKAPSQTLIAWLKQVEWHQDCCSRWKATSFGQR